MENIFLPVDVTGKCVVVYDKDTIRVYDELQPEIETNVSFTDFYINNHYLEVRGNTILDNPVTCLNNEMFTTSIYYRFDFPSILLMVFIYVVLIFSLVKMIILPFFRRVK